MGLKASTQLIAKLTSRYGTQLGKTAKNGTMAFQEVMPMQDCTQRIVRVFNSEGKMIKRHEEWVDKGGGECFLTLHLLVDGFQRVAFQ